MVVDTSAVIAILLGEPETDSFVRALADDPKRMISAFNALESAIVIEAKKGEAGGRELDLLMHRARIDIIALNSDQVEQALTAWRKYGKGNHPAGLPPFITPNRPIPPYFLQIFEKIPHLSPIMGDALVRRKPYP